MKKHVLMRQIANDIVEGNYTTHREQMTPVEKMPAEMPESIQLHQDKKEPAPGDLSDALDTAMHACLKKYEAGEFLLPDLIIRAAYTGQSRKKLSEFADDSVLFSKGKAVLATVGGKDYTHWQDMVDKILKGLGYQTINLGGYAAPQSIIDAVNREHPAILGIATPSMSLIPEINSISTISSVPAIKKLIENFAGKDYRKHVKILIGGNVASIPSADDVGADYRCSDMLQTVRFLKTFGQTAP